jgi:hypothetical protein
MHVFPIFRHLTLLLFAGSLIFHSCSGDRPPREGFVHIKDGRFMLDGERYHPVMLNYLIEPQTDGRNIWPGPYRGYTPGYRTAHNDPDSSLLQIASDFALIRSMGFNGVRIAKFAEGPLRNKATGDHYLLAFINGRDTLLPMDDVILTNLHNAVKDVARLAKDAGLHVVLLTILHPGDQELEKNWISLARALRDESAIMAYDLFNEPLYFDSLERSKQEVLQIVKEWRKLVDRNAPDQMFTLGLQGIREVFEWDPNMLDVDFLSFHPYEYEPEQVRNEMRWYHEQIRLPWIIGETSLPADGDSVPFSDQLEFARNTLRQTFACGGGGYSWWQYKDVPWGEFHSDNMGLVTLEGNIWPQGAALPTPGNPKPAAQAFIEFDPGADHGDCLLLPNYENYSGHTTSMISGILVDEMDRPIAGGVVIGWNEYFSHSYHTTSRADGRFNLKGDFHFYHWMASATCHAMVRDGCHPGSFLARTPGGIPEFHAGRLRLASLGCD